MTIRTENFQILQSAIIVYAVDVMKFERNQLSKPLDVVALLTSGIF